MKKLHFFLAVLAVLAVSFGALFGCFSYDELTRLSIGKMDAYETSESGNILVTARPLAFSFYNPGYYPLKDATVIYVISFYDKDGVFPGGEKKVKNILCKSYTDNSGSTTLNVSKVLSSNSFGKVIDEKNYENTNAVGCFTNEDNECAQTGCILGYSEIRNNNVNNPKITNFNQIPTCNAIIINEDVPLINYGFSEERKAHIEYIFNGQLEKEYPSIIGIARFSLFAPVGANQIPTGLFEINLCLPVFLLFGLLFATMFATGNNPFFFFELSAISSARALKGPQKTYSAASANLGDINVKKLVASVKGSISEVKGFTERLSQAKQANTKEAKEKKVEQLKKEMKEAKDDKEKKQIQKQIEQIEKKPTGKIVNILDAMKLGGLVTGVATVGGKVLGKKAGKEKTESSDKKTDEKKPVQKTNELEFAGGRANKGEGEFTRKYVKESEKKQTSVVGNVTDSKKADSKGNIFSAILSALGSAAKSIYTAGKYVNKQLGKDRELLGFRVSFLNLAGGWEGILKMAIILGSGGLGAKNTGKLAGQMAWSNLKYGVVASSIRNLIMRPIGSIFGKRDFNALSLGVIALQEEKINNLRKELEEEKKKGNFNKANEIDAEIKKATVDLAELNAASNIIKNLEPKINSKEAKEASKAIAELEVKLKGKNIDEETKRKIQAEISELMPKSKEGIEKEINSIRQNTLKSAKEKFGERDINVLITKHSFISGIMSTILTGTIMSTGILATKQEKRAMKKGTLYEKSAVGASQLATFLFMNNLSKAGYIEGVAKSWGAYKSNPAGQINIDKNGKITSYSDHAFRVEYEKDKGLKVICSEEILTNEEKKKIDELRNKQKTGKIKESEQKELERLEAKEQRVTLNEDEAKIISDLKTREINERFLQNGQSRIISNSEFIFSIKEGDKDIKIYSKEIDGRKVYFKYSEGSFKLLDSETDKNLINKMSQTFLTKGKILVNKEEFGNKALFEETRKKILNYSGRTTQITNDEISKTALEIVKLSDEKVIEYEYGHQVFLKNNLASSDFVGKENKASFILNGKVVELNVRFDSEGNLADLGAYKGKDFEKAYHETINSILERKNTSLDLSESIVVKSKLDENTGGLVITQIASGSNIYNLSNDESAKMTNISQKTFDQLASEMIFHSAAIKLIQSTNINTSITSEVFSQAKFGVKERFNGNDMPNLGILMMAASSTDNEEFKKKILNLLLSDKYEKEEAAKTYVRIMADAVQLGLANKDEMINALRKWNSEKTSRYDNIVGLIEDIREYNEKGGSKADKDAIYQTLEKLGIKDKAEFISRNPLGELENLALKETEILVSDYALLAMQKAEEFSSKLNSKDLILPNGSVISHDKFMELKSKTNEIFDKSDYELYKLYSSEVKNLLKKNEEKDKGLIEQYNEELAKLETKYKKSTLEFASEISSNEDYKSLFSKGTNEALVGINSYNKDKDGTGNIINEKFADLSSTLKENLSLSMDHIYNQNLKENVVFEGEKLTDKTIFQSIFGIDPSKISVSGISSVNMEVFNLKDKIGNDQYRNFLIDRYCLGETEKIETMSVPVLEDKAKIEGRYKTSDISLPTVTELPEPIYLPKIEPAFKVKGKTVEKDDGIIDVVSYQVNEAGSSYNLDKERSKRLAGEIMSCASTQPDILIQSNGDVLKSDDLYEDKNTKETRFRSSLIGKEVAIDFNKIHILDISKLTSEERKDLIDINKPSSPSYKDDMESFLKKAEDSGKVKIISLSQISEIKNIKNTKDIFVIIKPGENIVKEAKKK